MTFDQYIDGRIGSNLSGGSRPHVPDRVAEIAAQIAERHGVTWAELTSRSQTRRISRARFEVFHTLRNTDGPHGAPPTLTQMARWFDRDHSTVADGIRRWREILLTSGLTPANDR